MRLRFRILILSLISGIAAQCQNGFKDVGGSCYKFIIRPNSTYALAQAHCRSLGPNVNLATIRCDAENAAIFKMITDNKEYVEMVKNVKSKQPYKKNQHWLNAWIGLHDLSPKKAKTGIWYSDNTCNLYRRFGPGEPNNYGKNNEGCIELMYYHSRKASISKWNDLNCDAQMLSMVCEQQTENSGGVCNLKPCPDTILKTQAPVVQRDFVSSKVMSGGCRTGFKNVGGSCYKLILVNNATHEEAQKQCRKFGPGVNLATVRCEAENTAMYALMTSNKQYTTLVGKLKNDKYYKENPHGLNAWTGLHDTKNPAKWFMDNCNVYRHFAPGHPDTYSACGDLIYNHPNPNFRSKWSSQDCKTKMPAAICEEQTAKSGGACDVKPCKGSIYYVGGIAYVVGVNDTARDKVVRPKTVQRDLSVQPAKPVKPLSLQSAKPEKPLPVPDSALQKTVEVKPQGGFFQQFFTFNAREFLSALIEYVTKTTEKCQDLRCKELRAKENKQKL